MTGRERQVLDFVRATIERTGIAPTISEIADGIALRGRSGVHEALGQLIRAGHLDRTPHRERGLRLTGLPSLVAVPTAHLRAELARRGEAA